MTYDNTEKATTVSASVASSVSNVLTNDAATQTNTSTYTVTTDFTPSDTANYNSLTAAAAGNFVINKGTPTLSVNNSPVTYNGSPKAATVSASVPGSVSSILTGGAATQTAAGTYAVTANFVPTDTANYNSLTVAAAGNFVINKATPTLLVNNSPVTYDGTGKAATVSASVPGSVSSILTGGAATQTSAGTYAVTANFTPTDTANYNSLTAATAGDFEVFTALSGTSPSAWLPGFTAATIPVTFVAKDSGGNILGSNEVQVVTANGGQSFTFIVGVPSDTATISLKPRFYLRKKFTVSIAGNQVTLDMSGTTFVGGDANGD